MQLALSAPSMPPLLSVWVELSANSRQGFTTNNQAWRPAPDAINSTTAIGLRAGLFLEAVRKSHCARYYNPLTGRFMSRDPNDPKLIGPDKIPIDPKKLHKYLYADGDPVNMADPRGQAAIYEYSTILVQNLENTFGEEVDELGLDAVTCFVFTRVEARLSGFEYPELFCDLGGL